MRSSSSSGATNQQTGQLELAFYLSRDAPDLSDRRLLSWWEHQEDLPRLKKMALSLLSIQASSAGPERIWSHAKFVLSDLRMKMNPQTFGDAIVVGCNPTLV